MCEPWLNETYPTRVDLVSQDGQNCVDTVRAEGTGEASVLLCGHAHWDSALSLTGPGGGRRGGRAVALGWEHILVDGTC